MALWLVPARDREFISDRLRANSARVHSQHCRQSVCASLMKLAAARVRENAWSRSAMPDSPAAAPSQHNEAVSLATKQFPCPRSRCPSPRTSFLVHDPDVLHHEHGVLHHEPVSTIPVSFTTNPVPLAPVSAPTIWQRANATSPPLACAYRSQQFDGICSR